MAENIGKLAQRYARALYKVVTEDLGGSGVPTPAQETASALVEFAELWQSSSDFSSTIVNPMFESEQRLNALLALARRAGLNEVAQRFLRVVFEKERIAAFPEIALAFAELADREAGVVQVEVTLARDVSDEEKRSIEGSLMTHISGTLSVTWQIDSSLLGGMKVCYQGKILDGSLSGRLSKIETKMTGY